jgi:hypothetical protein
MEDTGVYELVLLPLHIFLHPLFTIHSHPVTAGFQSLLQLRFQIPSFLSLIQLFALGLLLVGVIFSLVPLLLILLLSLFPAPSSILVVNVPVSDIAHFADWLAEFSLG